jgi:hypothetical protein
MMYLLDLFFVLGYLIMKRTFKIMHDSNYPVFVSIRALIGWCEYSFVLLWMYIIPDHTWTEGAVSFSMCICTKLAFQYCARKEFIQYWKCKIKNAFYTKT